MRANGYSYDAVKIFMPAGAKKPIYARYREHVPPDVTACILWLKNRDPAHWRYAWQIEHAIGKYIISEKPMTEEQWIKERATGIDVTPESSNVDEQGSVRLPAPDALADRADEAPARGRGGCTARCSRPSCLRGRSRLGDQEPPDEALWTNVAVTRNGDGTPRE
jgi:hypothetical protein